MNPHSYFYPSKLIPLKILLLYLAYPVNLPHTTCRHPNVVILQNYDRKGDQGRYHRRRVSEIICRSTCFCFLCKCYIDRHMRFS